MSRRSCTVCGKGSNDEAALMMFEDYYLCGRDYDDASRAVLHVTSENRDYELKIVIQRMREEVDLHKKRLRKIYYSIAFGVIAISLIALFTPIDDLIARTTFLALRSLLILGRLFLYIIAAVLILLVGYYVYKELLK